jgi:signal transduction histidine kinase
MEGQAALDIEDQEGTSPGREMLRLLESEEEGWVSYYWPRPDGSRSKAAKKEAFVKEVLLGDELLVVGAGVYLD